MASRPRLIHLLNSAQRHLLHWVGQQQAQAALHLGGPVPSAAQAGALFVLKQQDGVTMGQLAQSLGLEPPAASGLVGRIEAMGWATRRPCPDDRRTQRVWLLPEGRALLPELQIAMKRINLELTRGLSPDELDVVARWLEHVRHLPMDTRPTAPDSTPDHAH